MKNDKLKISAWHMELPFKVSFKHALKERTTSSSVLTKLTLSDGFSGYGEGLPRDYVSGESVESVLHAIQYKLMPDLKEQEGLMNSPKDVENLTRRWLESPETSGDITAIGAVEIALINALSARAGQNIYDWLGRPAKKKSIKYSMILSCGDEKKLIKHLLLSRLFCVDELKLKVTSDLAETASAMKIIRNYHPKANVRIDANCDWNVATAVEQLNLLSNYQISSCEQPLPKDDITGLSQLVAQFSGILICPDESLCSYADAQKLIAHKAATSFNIRITKNGGLFNSLRIHQLAKENGIKCQLGALVGETSILSLYGRVFASITGDLLFHEGSFGTRLLKEDICTNPSMFGFRGLAPATIKGNGIGLNIEDKIIHKYAMKGMEF